MITSVIQGPQVGNHQSGHLNLPQMRRRVGEVRHLSEMRPARGALAAEVRGEEGGERSKQEGLRSVIELCPLRRAFTGLLLTHT